MSETRNRDILDRNAGEIVQALAAREVGALEIRDAAIAPSLDDSSGSSAAMAFADLLARAFGGFRSPHGLT